MTTLQWLPFPSDDDRLPSSSSSNDNCVLVVAVTVAVTVAAAAAAAAATPTATGCSSLLASYYIYFDMFVYVGS